MCRGWHADVQVPTTASWPGPRSLPPTSRSLTGQCFPSLASGQTPSCWLSHLIRLHCCLTLYLECPSIIYIAGNPAHSGQICGLHLHGTLGSQALCLHKDGALEAGQALDTAQGGSSRKFKGHKVILKSVPDLCAL